MKALELFAGIGGIALAEQMAGIEVVGLSEIEDYPVRILKKNFPDIPILKDVRKINKKALKEAQMMTVTSGQICLELSKKSSQIGLLEKMLLISPIWNSTERYLTWKARVTKRGHMFYQLQPSVPHISGCEHSLWPTPTASDGIAWKKVKQTDVIGSIQRAMLPKKGKRKSGQLRYTYYLQVQNYSPNQAASFGEMMMGFPVGWTDLSA